MGKYFTSEYSEILNALSSSGSNLPNSANAVADSQKSIGDNLKSSISNFLSMSTWDGGAKQALTAVWEGVSQVMGIANDLIANNLVTAANLAVPTLRALLKTIKEKEEKLVGMEAELVRLEKDERTAYNAYINTPDTISDTDSSGSSTRKTNPAKAIAKTAWDAAVGKVKKQKTDVGNMETELTAHTNEAASIIGQIKGLNGGAGVPSTPSVNMTSTSLNPIFANGMYMFNGEQFKIANIKGYSSPQEFANAMQAMGLTNIGNGTSSRPQMDGWCDWFTYTYLGLMTGDPGVTKLIKGAYQGTNGIWYHANGQQLTKMAIQKEWNSRPFVADSFKGTREQQEQYRLKVIKEQLDKGIPVAVKLTHTGSHYGLVVGYRAGASNPLKNSDLLFMDSWDGKIKRSGAKNGRSVVLNSPLRIYSPSYSA